MPPRNRLQSRAKTRSATGGLGERGITLIADLVAEMKSNWTATGSTEVGIDGYLELFDPSTGATTGLHLAVQSKAVTNFGGDDETVTFSCKAEDVAYWKSSTTPVIVVVSCPRTREAYWAAVRAQFAESGGLTLRIDRRAQRFGPQSYDALLEAARPRDASVVRAAVPVRELLYSNLLPIEHVPATIYVAAATCRTRSQAWAVLLDADKDKRVPDAWALDDGSIFSFVDPARSVLREICDVATVEEHQSAEFAERRDEVGQRVFPQLLLGALRDDLEMAGVRFHHAERVFAFKKLEEEERRHTYSSFQQQSELAVVSAYASTSKDGTVYPYYRHNAFVPRFRRLGEVWHLEVTPTYRFTTDGRARYRFHKERLAKIKRIEKNRSVLSQLMVWADMLRPQPSLLDPRRPMLSFGDVLTFPVDVGVPDDDWSAVAEDDGGDASSPLLDRLTAAGT